MLRFDDHVLRIICIGDRAPGIYFISGVMACGGLLLLNNDDKKEALDTHLEKSALPTPSTTGRPSAYSGQSASTPGGSSNMERPYLPYLALVPLEQHRGDPPEHGFRIRAAPYNEADWRTQRQRQNPMRDPGMLAQNGFFGGMPPLSGDQLRLTLTYSYHLLFWFAPFTLGCYLNRVYARADRRSAEITANNNIIFTGAGTRPNDETCMICLEEFDTYTNIVTTGCPGGHLMHRECRAICRINGHGHKCPGCPAPAAAPAPAPIPRDVMLAHRLAAALGSLGTYALPIRGPTIGGRHCIYMDIYEFSYIF
ncbi:hypothetical protein N9L68_01045 [bacterium]|nr:hypothetical protein [bacterium]